MKGWSKWLGALPAVIVGAVLLVAAMLEALGVLQPGATATLARALVELLGGQLHSVARFVS
jgi:hypothetical protein